MSDRRHDLAELRDYMVREGTALVAPLQFRLGTATISTIPSSSISAITME